MRVYPRCGHAGVDPKQAIIAPLGAEPDENQPGANI